jgi:hypothetical protein
LGTASPKRLLYDSFVSEVLMTTITLEQFHLILRSAFAVCVNDTLYFVGYDTDDNPYIADNNGDDYVDLSVVDGDIEVFPYYVLFYVGGEMIKMSFLNMKKLM